MYRPAFAATLLLVVLLAPGASAQQADNVRTRETSTNRTLQRAATDENAGPTVSSTVAAADALLTQDVLSGDSGSASGVSADLISAVDVSDGAAGDFFANVSIVKVSLSSKPLGSFGLFEGPVDGLIGSEVFRFPDALAGGGGISAFGDLVAGQVIDETVFADLFGNALAPDEGPLELATGESVLTTLEKGQDVSASLVEESLLQINLTP